MVSAIRIKNASKHNCYYKSAINKCSNASLKENSKMNLVEDNFNYI